MVKRFSGAGIHDLSYTKKVFKNYVRLQNGFLGYEK